MSESLRLPDSFPVDPLDHTLIDTAEWRRRTIVGILDSYNSNYDMLAEAAQNAVDALEDAQLTALRPPYSLDVTINLAENWFAVLDTGIGMRSKEVCQAFAPNVSFKDSCPGAAKRTSANAYRGYKGVGLTFLAYGCDDVTIHSKANGKLTKGRMRYGRAWARGERTMKAVIVEDERSSPLDRHARGTYVRFQLAQSTRPKSLSHLASDPKVWSTILRTRTAAGQMLLGGAPAAQFTTQLHVVDSTGECHNFDVTPKFLFPHEVERTPPFRFLDLPAYYKTHGERSEPPAEKLRQDGLYLTWDTERLAQEIPPDSREQYAEEIKRHAPRLYAFLPYQGSVWAELNQILTASKKRTHLYPGLLIGVNRQRLADTFELRPTRFETMSRNVLVLVHFDDARPDQGRKTLQDELVDLANKAADRAVQYLARQRSLLRAPGESPTPEQREVEKDHSDWEFNVRTHARSQPLHAPPITYASIPLTEQDVVGLFHQLSVLGVFPGIRVYATSQSKTYDCLAEYECPPDRPNLKYVDAERAPLGLSPYVLGDSDRFTTRLLTVEFKNNLDGLIDDVEGESSKSFKHIDLLVCWSTVSTTFPGYQLQEVTEAKLDEREYPGATHLLHRDAENHVVQVIMLETVLKHIEAGRLSLPRIAEPTEAVTKDRG